MRKAIAFRARFSTACLLCLGILLPAARAEETAIDLTAADAAAHWRFTEPTGALKDEELIFDGRKEMSRGFFLPLMWQDVSLQADFLIEFKPAILLAWEWPCAH